MHPGHLNPPSTPKQTRCGPLLPVTQGEAEAACLRRALHTAPAGTQTPLRRRRHPDGAPAHRPSAAVRRCLLPCTGCYAHPSLPPSSAASSSQATASPCAFCLSRWLRVALKSEWLERGAAQPPVPLKLHVRSHLTRARTPRGPRRQRALARQGTRRRRAGSVERKGQRAAANAGHKPAARGSGRPQSEPIGCSVKHRVRQS